MRTVYFVCEEHLEYGTNGWRPKNQPGFDPLNGNAVAHDLLEHFPDGDESPHHEFQALGAATWGRGGSGLYENPHIPFEKHLGVEFPEIFAHVLHESMPLPEPTRTYPLRDGWAEATLQEAIREGDLQCEDEFDREELQAIRELLPSALGWLRIGYRRAARRYRAHGPTQIAELFMRIRNEADDLLKQAKIGDELAVTVSIRRLQAKLRMHYREDYYY